MSHHFFYTLLNFKQFELLVFDCCCLPFILIVRCVTQPCMHIAHYETSSPNRQKPDYSHTQRETKFVKQKKKKDKKKTSTLIKYAVCNRMKVSMIYRNRYLNSIFVVVVCIRKHTTQNTHRKLTK